MKNLSVWSGLLTFGISAVALAGPPAARSDHEWTVTEVQRGAATVQAVIARRLDYATTYRLARGQLEKNVHTGKDNRGFIAGAQLALAHWIARLPEDTAWKTKALARHRDVAYWLGRESPLPLEQLAHAVAQARGLPAAEEPWLLSVLKGEPSTSLPGPAPTAKGDQ